jgi:predicted DNA-binding transcriptional regulator AlpA
MTDTGRVAAESRRTQTRALSDIRPVPRRGLSRSEAAMYIGISASKFDELVADRRMPGPIKIDGRNIWDIRDLDLAFDALPREDAAPNSWEGV